MKRLQIGVNLSENKN